MKSAAIFIGVSIVMFLIGAGSVLVAIRELPAPSNPAPVVPVAPAVAISPAPPPPTVASVAPPTEIPAAAPVAPPPTEIPAAPSTPAAAPAGGLDRGDGKSSTLTNRAWKALNAKNYDESSAYAEGCIETFGARAVQMQATLKAPADKESAAQYWALNEVGTCYFILGKSLDERGDKKGAIVAYKFLVNNLPFAQCWDPKGWFWRPASAAQKRLVELQIDAMP